MIAPLNNFRGVRKFQALLLNPCCVHLFHRKKDALRTQRRGLKDKNRHSIYLWSDILDFKVDYKIKDDKVHEYSLTIFTNVIGFAF